MRTSGIITATLGLTLGVASTAHAGLATNGLSANGINPNGLSYNGRDYNGREINGREQGGSHDQDRSAGPTGDLRVRSVHLPDGRTLTVRQP